MTDNDIFTQCRLQRGKSEQIVWIPSCYARVGKPLKLRLPNGNWENGWIVEAAYGKATKAVILMQERLYKRTRKYSDVAKGTFKNDKYSSKLD